MKKVLFAIVSVLLIVSVLVIPCFADSFPNTTKGAFPERFETYLNDSVLSYARWLYLDSQSTIDFVSIPTTLSNYGYTVTWSVDIIDNVVYHVYSIDIFIQTGFACIATICTQNTSNIYNGYFYYRQSSMSTANWHVQISAYLTSRDSSATCYSGFWQLCASGGSNSFVGSQAFVGPSGSSTFHSGSNGFTVGIDYRSGSYSMYYSDVDMSSTLGTMYVCSCFSFATGLNSSTYPTLYSSYDAVFSCIIPQVKAAKNDTLTWNPYYPPEEPADPEIISLFSVLREFVFSVFQAPSVLLASFLDFDIMGVNFYVVAKGLITISLLALVVAFIIKIVLRFK